MKFYNSLTRKIEEFVPIKKGKVGMYACGMTVYDYSHIGHGRKYVNDDILRRTLSYLGFEVYHVQNVTDVGHLVSDADEGEDKMEKGARKFGKDVWELARFFTDNFYKSMDKLNILRPNVICKATDHIKEQIDLVKRIEDKGFFYKTEDGIYFDVIAFEKDGNKYGELSNLQDIKAGARVDVIEGKKDPRDFALWKFSPKSFDSAGKRQMEWDSPWGVGFPGWHIECSAMSMKYLGEQFDIHTGGEDHISTHHPNEIAQSEAATGKKPFAKYWFHTAFLLIDGVKMSKSLSNLFTVDDVITKGFEALDLRYLFLTAHYRRQMNFTWESLEAAKRARGKLLNIMDKLKGEGVAADPEKAISVADGEAYILDFDKAIMDDLNMPKALAVVWDLVKSDLVAEVKLDLLSEFDQVLGLNLFADVSEKSIKIPEKIKDLIKKREDLKKAKKYLEADELREEIEKEGYVIKDTAEGAVVIKSVAR
jgi:cysteinyl-tRNA synthetase